MSVITTLLNDFNKINEDYIAKLDYLLTKTERQKKEILLDKKVKMKFDKKKSYKPLLKFTVNQFEQSLIDFKNVIVKGLGYKVEDVNNRFKTFLNDKMSILQNKANSFKKLFKHSEQLYKRNNIKKDSFYRYLHDIQFKKLNKFRNIKGGEDYIDKKEFSDLDIKEKTYQSICLKLNSQFEILRNEFSDLLKYYSKNIRNKFFLFNSTILKSFRNKRKKTRFEVLIEEFRVDFLDLQMGLYINNSEELYDRWFSLKKLVDYESKLRFK